MAAATVVPPRISPKDAAVGGQHDAGLQVSLGDAWNRLEAASAGSGR